MTKIAFKSGQLTIHGTLVLPEAPSKPVPGVIIFHGMTSSETGYIPLAASLAAHGIAGLAISMRGHGESQGDFKKATVAEAIQDALKAYDFLVAQRGVDSEKIGACGSSVGAILAAMLATQRSLQSVVFRAPAAYTAAMMQLTMAETMINEGRQFHTIGNLENTPAGAAIKQFNGSLLAIASENDALIPLSVSQGYLDIAHHSVKKQLLIIENATHTLTEPAWKETFRQAAVEWFRETL